MEIENMVSTEVKLYFMCHNTNTHTHTDIYLPAFQIVCAGNLVLYVKQTNRPKIKMRRFFRDTNKTIRRFTYFTYIYIYNPLKLNNKNPHAAVKIISNTKIMFNEMFIIMEVMDFPAIQRATQQRSEISQRFST